MSRLSDYMKANKERDERFFYGESVKHTSNKYFTFDHVIDDDTIIFNTNNIRTIKGNPVLVVDHNKAVYLKDWQIRRVHNYDWGLNTYCVKLNRQYFKPYTFSFDFDDLSFDKEQTFDFLKNIVSTQNGTELAAGWMG